MLAKHEDANYNGPIELYTRPQPAHSAPVQPVAVPDGWKLVPFEPTREMLEAWVSAPFESRAKMTAREVREGRAKKEWQAMLNVAPAAPAAQGDAVPEGWQAAKDAYIKLTNSPAYANHEVRYMADHDVMSALDKFFDTSAGAQAIDAAIAAKAAS